MLNADAAEFKMLNADAAEFKMLNPNAPEFTSPNLDPSIPPAQPASAHLNAQAPAFTPSP
jgi:hypothetical protein